MPELAVLDAFDPRGTGLRITFVWRQDRFAQEVSLCQAGSEGSEQPLARSREGLPHEDWPDSPAFQQLLVEPRGEGRYVALLVGMSGTSHWSASVEPVVGKAAFEFDVACRLRTAPPSLRCVYEELAAAPDAAPATPSHHLRFTSETPTTVVRDVSKWTIRAALHDLRLPCTIRWRYRIALEPREERA